MHGEAVYSNNIHASSDYHVIANILILCMHVHISDISAITAIMERLQGHAGPRPPKLEDNVIEIIAD